MDKADYGIAAVPPTLLTALYLLLRWPACSAATLAVSSVLLFSIVYLFSLGALSSSYDGGFD